MRHDGHEDGKDGKLPDRVLEKIDHHGHQETCSQIEDEPWNAHAYGAPGGAENPLRCIQAGESIDIFGRLVLDDVNDVISAKNFQKKVVWTSISIMEASTACI